MKYKNNIAIFISGKGSNMRELIKKSLYCSAKIKLIFANKNCYGLQVAKKYDIPIYFYESKNFYSKFQFEKKILKLLEKHNVNWIFLAGFMYIFSNFIIKKFKGKIINIHPSLLPNYKGLNTHYRVLKDKQKYHGVTIHLITEKIDEGPIILQAKTKIDSNENENSLSQKVLKIEHLLYPSVMVSIVNGYLKIFNDKICWINKSCLPKEGKNNIICIK